MFGFFFLDRSCELWGPFKRPRSNQNDDDLDPAERVHGLKLEDVTMIGDQAIEVHFRSSKADRTKQGTKIRLYRSGDIDLCPVRAFVDIKRARDNIERKRTAIGPYLTSTTKSTTISRNDVAKTLKQAAIDQGLDPSTYSNHSIRIGGACALLAAGFSDTVIKLMGRWASWCFVVHTRLKPGIIKNVSTRMVEATAEWDDECGGSNSPM